MKLELETSYRDVDLLEAPGLAVVELTHEKMARIIELSELGIRHDLLNVCDIDFYTDWTEYKEDDEGETIPGDPLRVELCRLIVSKKEFWWACYVKHTDVELVTESTNIDETCKRRTE